jgi:DNA replication and repair protein RecF
MFTLYPGHIRHLAAYGRALKQRNRFLGIARERQFVDEAQLDSWDQALVTEGAPVIWNRMRYVTQMKAEIPEALFGTELLRIHYLSTVAAGAATLSEIETLFRAALHRGRALDLRLGFTSVGPHRDDLKMFLNGRALGEFGSAGQQRSSLLSLYFAQMEIHRKTHGFYPVFLVDDVEAELDDLRLRAFIDYLSRRTQTFLTTAKEGLLPSFPGETQRFEIRSGNILG